MEGQTLSEKSHIRKLQRVSGDSSDGYGEYCK